MIAAIDQKISPMIWFDNQAEEATKFYVSVFPNSRSGRLTRYGKEGYEIHGQKEGTVSTIELELDGQKFTMLNGGPVFKANPSVSFCVVYEKERLVDELWTKLSDGGQVLMPYQQYPFAQKYGWIQDKFGISWQLMVGNQAEAGGTPISTCLLFVGANCGRAEEAINFYMSVFPDTKVDGILRYDESEKPEKAGSVKHAQFHMAGETFMAMDSNKQHDFNFSEGISLVISCETQEEIDYYWNKLSEGGDPRAQQCGWLKDKFGVSWQVTPHELDDMLMDSDRTKTERVTKAFLQMKKFNIEELRRAYEGR